MPGYDTIIHTFRPTYRSSSFERFIQIFKDVDSLCATEQQLPILDQASGLIWISGHLSCSLFAGAGSGSDI